MKLSNYLVLLFGLIVSAPLAADERVPWTDSRLIGSPDPAKPYTIEPAYPNLQFNQPVEVCPLPGSNWMLLLEVGGKVFLFEDWTECSTPIQVGNLRECSKDFVRALSIRPHPEFAKNKQVFVCYAENPVAKPDGTKLSRFKMQLGEKPSLDIASEEVLLTWPSGGHNGCSIRFDAQGLMYFSAGDGAKPYPPDEYDVGQNLSDLRSTICRIDVDTASEGRKYSIPADNPFRNLGGARPEIWAYGFRNPWRFCIDPATNQLICGDVGWELWEMIFHVESGANYGWPVKEGPQPIRSDVQLGPTPIRKPLVAYSHTEGLSVTGGVVYRGEENPDLQGTYLYGDYVTGLLWGLRFDPEKEDEKVTYNELLGETGLPIISFGENRENEVLVISFTGEIYKLVANPKAGRPSEFPTYLSETGLYASLKTLEPSPGVYEYEIAATAYQGGTTNQLLLGVPGQGQIRSQKRKRNWKYPVNTVFAKTISHEVMVNGKLENRRIETQILLHDGLTWQPYCYQWNEAQTDASLVDVEGGFTEYETSSMIGEPEILKWRHHSRAECRACHTNQTGGAVSFSYENMLRIVGEEGDGVEQLVRLKLLDKPAPPSWGVKRMVDPQDTTQTLQDRARSYLHANCSHCHCRGGGGTVALDLVFSNTNEQINALSFATTQGGFGLEQSHVISPGDPYSSILYYRMATAGKGHMPKLWTRDNDEAGLQLVHDWIASLGQSKIDDGNPTAVALRNFHQLLKLAPEERHAAVVSKKQQADAITVGLFDRLLPASRRTQRLGNSIDSAAILAMEGNAARGRESYMHSKVSQCRNCHRLDNEGTMIGPDLDKLPKRSREELLDSILSPSRKIELKFATQSILTTDGQIFTGLLLKQDEDGIVLRSADGKEHRVHPGDVEVRKQLKASLMPDGLAEELTAQELADLLAFLAELNRSAKTP